MIVEVGDIVADDGTVVIFDGHDTRGGGYRFVVDHHQAQAIVDEFNRGATWPEVEVEDWQILGRI